MCLLASPGCVQISHRPSVHNPFPQLSKVAVAPFFNLSSEPTVDGRQFAIAYFNELQSVPGFEVVPVGVVEKTLELHNIPLAGPEDARRLAEILSVDAVVIGAVTDFSPYYPPRCGLQIEWYAANPCFHPIPPGYGLPWGTPAEEEIPPALIFEAEMALARAQLKTQTPTPATAEPNDTENATEESAALDHPNEAERSEIELLSHAESVDAGVASVTTGATGTGLPPDWPDPSGFTPPAPSATPPPCVPTNEPVLRHARVYNGHDADFTAALESYVYFRDDARFGGWQAYLERSDDFIRFCCHIHIAEMLTARGGAGKTQVVWRWGTNR